MILAYMAPRVLQTMTAKLCNKDVSVSQRGEELGALNKWINGGRLTVGSCQLSITLYVTARYQGPNKNPVVVYSNQK